jgi:Xaa-Pro aminopeptidase
MEGQSGGSAEKLARLRAELARQGAQGFIVPRSDEHQGEYVPPSADRLAWLTGFTGSAGLAVVLPEKAALFVDGRYTLQAKAQIEAALYGQRHLTEEPAGDFIARNLKPGEALGYDPWLLTPGEVERYRAACEKAGGTLKPLASNPLDAIWKDRPSAPTAPAVPHKLEFSGKASDDKRRELARKLAEDKIDAAILAAPDSICWLLNIRGGDLVYTPVALCFAILHADASVDLFIDKRKVSGELEAHLGKEVRISPPESLGAALAKLGAAKKRVLADPAGTASWIFDRLAESGATIIRAPDPCLLPKACKNAVELEGSRAAHRRDGAALTRFLAWLAAAASKGGIREISASDRLAEFRRSGSNFKGLSFPTISGAGSNGAIVHYHASPATERGLENGSLYLVDSGAQYLDGTTDVTRTVAIGNASAEMRDRFTRVLKGHIALACCRFPQGTTGSQLDALARRPLWEAGLDYDHGTGHGVGSYLGVHEGPQRISKAANNQALLPGMIVSNEPGYYKTGAYGIRIENLVAVIELGEAGEGTKKILGFETLTLAPIDLALVEPLLLDAHETRWLDAYHARCRKELGPLLDAATRSWLERVTQPLVRG